MSESSRAPGKPGEKRQPHDPYPITTSQEADAILRGASHGKTGAHWTTHEQALARVFEMSDLSHSLRLRLSDDDIEEGATLKELELLTVERDADAVLAILYISHLLVPEQPLAPRTAATADVDIDDVLRAIGWRPETGLQRRQMRAKVWSYIRFGARAEIIGVRSGTYRDKTTGEAIETVIEEAPWAITRAESVAQPSLFPTLAGVPVTVRLTASRKWTALTTSPATAQFLPMGERLGAIMADKPSGAWARVIGVALANFWRRQPKAALDGSLKPTRAELLERYPPKLAPAATILESNDPLRALRYWIHALELLVQAGFVEKVGEAALTLEEMRQRGGRQGWKTSWLNETVDLRPGPMLRETIQDIVAARPVLPPRELKRKRGRPRKNA